MMSEGASQSLIRMDAVEIAKIPMERKMSKEPMVITLYQLRLLFKPINMNL
jgi:hypothetical protein